MEMQALILSLLILSIVSPSEPRSLETPIACASTCKEPANVGLNERYSYEYRYTAAVRSTFNANLDESSLTNMNIDVAIDVRNPCEHVLRVISARLESPDQTISSQSLSAWESSLREHPLHFSWQDGKIPTICASNDDPAWVLNIKRGILSTLQVSSVETVEAIEETDVTGKCESSYVVTDTTDGHQVSKSKNYDTCKGREQHLLFTFFTPYSSESPRQNFIHSSQNCTQTLSRKQIRETVCNEAHTFRPFSNEESGAQTIIQQRLVFRRRLSYTPEDTEDILTVGNERRTNLVFEKEDEDTIQSRDISNVQRLFENLCSTMDTEYYELVAKDFIKLVYLLRRLDVTAIEQVQSSIQGICPKRRDAFREMFKDALQWCGSEGCVVFAARLIASGADAVPDQTASSWLNGMNLITKPTSDMLDAVMTIVESGRLKDKAYLTAGNMINRRCKEPSSCMTNPAIRRSLTTFEGKLGVNCRTANVDAKQEIVLALRALGNAGRTSAISTLAQCARAKDNDLETRVAAIQAFRRMPCQTDRSALTRMLENDKEDSEIRINSYLALMKCPTPNLIQTVIILLDGDNSLQVKSFLWSHVNQFLESKDPLKGYVKPLLAEIAFAKANDLDPRKYSKYYEASVFSEKLNAGATVESSLIWSPESFVPRSADLGLSVDVFGQAVNLFEVGGRVEGFEKLVQRMLTSDALMKNNPIAKLFMSPDADDEEPDEEEEDDVRVRRSLASQRDALVLKQRSFEENLRESLEQPEAAGNWYMRVFGNEMYYDNARNLKARFGGIDGRSLIQQLLQNDEYHYHDDTILMNSIHTLPTGPGLPLTIAFNSSASVDVSISGRVDLSRLFTSAPSFEIRGKMTPRAVIVVSGAMSVDARVAKSGIATETTASTSWNLGGTASIENGKKFSVALDSPYQNNTLFKFRHAVSKIIGERKEEFGSSQVNSLTDCTREYVGQRLCVSRPRAMDVFPTQGAIEFSAYMEKRDAFTQYVMNGSYDSTNENKNFLPSAFSLSVDMNTPNSTARRNTGIKLSYDMSEMRFGFELNHTSNNINITGQMHSKSTRKQVTIRYLKNGEETVFNSDARKTVVGEAITWQASTSLEKPRVPPIQGIASVTIDPNRNFSALLRIENVLGIPNPVLVNVTLLNKSDPDSNRFWYMGHSQMKIFSLIDTGGNFNLKLQPRNNNFKFRLAYQFGNADQKQIVFNHKRQNRSNAERTKWTAEQKLLIEQYPSFNHFISLSYQNDSRGMSSSVKFEYDEKAGRPYNSKYIYINESFSYLINGSEEKLNVAGVVDIPPADVSYSAGLNLVIDNAFIDTNLTLDDYRARFRLQNKRLTNDVTSTQALLETPTPWGRIYVNSSFAEVGPHVFEFLGMLRFGEANRLSAELNCTVKDLVDVKSVSIVVKDESRTEYLSASSVLRMDNNSFEFDTAISSIFNNPVQFLLRHQRTDIKWYNEARFEYQPNRYFRVRVQNNPGNRHTQNIFIDFKTPDGQLHYVGLEGGTVSDENNIGAFVSFRSNLTKPALSLGAAVEMSLTEERRIRGNITNESLEYFGFDGTLRMDDSIDVTLSLRQEFLRVPWNVSFEGSVAVGKVRTTMNAFFNFTSFDSYFLKTNINTELSRVFGNLTFRLCSSPSTYNFVILKQSDEVEITIVDNSENTLVTTLTRDVNNGNIYNFELKSTLNNTDIIQSQFWVNFNDLKAQFHYAQVKLRKLPKIDVSINARVKKLRFEGTFDLNNETSLSADFTWTSNKIVFGWKNNLIFEFGIPRSVELSLRKLIADDSKMREICRLDVDGKLLTITLGKLSISEKTGIVGYNSTFPSIAGSFVFGLTKFSNPSGYKLDMVQAIVQSWPQKVGFSISEQNNQWNLTSHYNDNKMNLSIAINLPQRNTAVYLSHNVLALENLGIPTSFRANASLSLSLTSGIQSVGWNGTLRIDEVDYYVFFTRAMKTQMPVQLNFTVGHNIECLYQRGMPWEITSNTEVGYRASEILVYGNTELQRVYVDERTGDKVTRKNFMNANASMPYFHNNVDIRVSHNFAFQSVPKLLKLTIHTQSSNAFGLFRRFKMIVTRDKITEKVDFTLLFNREQESIMISFEQNFNFFNRCCIPESFSFAIEKTSQYAADLKVTIDNLNRTVSFAFDFDSHKKKLTADISHDFAAFRKAKIPEKMGLLIVLPNSNHEAEFEVKFTLRNTIGIFHPRLTWESTLSEGFAFSYHQNMTKHIPKQLRIGHRKNVVDNGFVTRLSSGNRFVRIEFIPEIGDIPRDSVLLTQNFDPDLGSYLQFLWKFDSFPFSLELIKDGLPVLQTSINPVINSKYWGVDVFFLFSLNKTGKYEFFAEVNYDTKITSNMHVDIKRPGFAQITAQCDWELDTANKRGHVELTQIRWKSFPEHIRVDMKYKEVGGRSEFDIFGHRLTINVTRDDALNQIEAITNVFKTNSSMYGSINIIHDFNNHIVPRRNLFGFSWEKSDDSFTIDANATTGNSDHSVRTYFIKTDRSIRVDQQILLRNRFLQNYGIPDEVITSLSAVWKKKVKIDFSTSFENGDATLEFQKTGKAITAGLELHQSLTSLVPNNVNAKGSIQLRPDYFVNFSSEIVGQLHHFEGGFNMYENGFSVTSVLDSVARNVEIRQNMIPGGFSFSIDHNIPELLDYVPESASFDASVKLQPQLNMTVAIRREKLTQQFNAEVNSKTMRFALQHDFEMLPFPRSVTIKLLKSTSPLTYEVCIRTDDLERTVRATFNFARKSAELFHSVPEFDKWFIPKSVAIGYTYTAEPLGGEIYLSVDGNFRRVGGSMSFIQKALNFHQNFTSSQSYPRNITLKLAGTLEPFQGKIVLEMDKTERSVEATLQPRNLLALLTVKIPETEEYIPRHMLISCEFNGASGNVNFAFDKNGRNQTISADWDVQDLSVNFKHNITSIAFFESVPSPIHFQANIESYEMSLQLTLKEILYVLSSTVNLDDGRYGLNLNCKVNDEIILTFTIEGQKKGKDYEMTANVTTGNLPLIGESTYHGKATITPKFKNRKKSLVGSYFHVYNNDKREINVDISLISKKNTKKDFSFHVAQTLPQSQALDATFTFRAGLDDNSDIFFFYNVSFCSAILDFEKCVFENYVDLNILQEQRTAKWKGAFVFDDKSYASAGNLTVHSSSSKMGVTGETNLQLGVSNWQQNKTYSIAALYFAELEGNRFSYSSLSTNQPSGEIERSDSIVLTTSSISPKISMRVDSVELNSDYNIPRSMDFSFDRNNNDINKHWVFNFTADGTPLIWTIDFAMQESPFFLNVKSSMTNSVSYLERLKLPSNALVNFTVDFRKTDYYTSNNTLQLEYNDLHVTYNAESDQRIGYGEGKYMIKHNVEELREWLGAFEWVENYWYQISKESFSSHCNITQDSEEIANYNLDLDFATKEFSYYQHYYGNSYHVVYENYFTDNQKHFLFCINETSKVLFKIDVNYFPSDESRFELQNHYFYDFGVKVTGSMNTLSATTSIEVENHNVSVTIQPDTSQPQLLGYRLTWLRRTLEEKIQAMVFVGFDKSCENGKFMYKLNGTDGHIQVAAIYSPTSCSVQFQHNGDYLSDDIPRNVEAEIQRKRITVEADSVSLVNFRRQSNGYSLKIRNTSNTVIFHNKVSYKFAAKKEVDIVLKVWNHDWSCGGDLAFFKSSTGNSSLNFYLKNKNEPKFSLSAYALPTDKYEPADFSGKLEISSKFDNLPVNFMLKCQSDYTADSSEYIGNYAAKYNEKEFSINFFFLRNNYTLAVVQPWIEATPVVTIHFDRKFSVPEKVNIANASFSWSNKNEDKLSISSILKSTATGLIYSLEAEQPSAIFKIKKCGVAINGSLSPGIIRFGVNSYLNDYELDMNGTYAGNLPRITGNHSLKVIVNQSIFSGILEHFVTSGNITISSLKYTSEWLIDNRKTDIVRLNKHFAVQDGEVTAGLLWEQYIFNAPVQLIQMTAAGATNGTRGRAFLQVGGHPAISASYNLSKTEDKNHTLKIDLKSGPLPLGFRTISFSSWFKNETGREVGPKIDISFILDNERYSLYLETVTRSHADNKRFTSVIEVAHPLNLKYFPKHWKVTVVALDVKKGLKLLFNYEDDNLNYPFKSGASYMFYSKTKKLRISTHYETDAKYDAELTYMPGSISFNTNYPNRAITREIILSYQNNDSEFEVDGLAKTYGDREDVETRQATFSFNKADQTFELDYIISVSDETHRTTFRGDLSQVIPTMKNALKTLASEAFSSRLSFISGINTTATSFDVYVGYQRIGGARYTLHLVGKPGESDASFSTALVIKKTEYETDIVRATLKLIGGQLVRLQLSANPVLVNFVRKTIEDLDAEAVRKINVFADCLVEILNSLKTIVRQNPENDPESEIPNVNLELDSLIDKVNDYRDQAIRFVATIASLSKNRFILFNSNTKERVHDALATLLNLVDKLRALVRQPFTDVFNEYFGSMEDQIKAVFVQKMRPVISVLEKFNAGQLLIDLIDEAMQNTRNYIMTNGGTSFDLAKEQLTDLFMVEETYVIVNVPLAFELNDLEPLPSTEDIKTWLARSALAITINEAMERLYSHVDDYYKARALLYIPRDEILPPFKGHAFVSGFTHFKTFDAKQYQFSSECKHSYILAEDLRDNNFTVVLTYGDVKNSLKAIVVQNQQEYIIVYEDYLVSTWKGTKELPIDSELTSITLEGNTVHVRRKEGDLDVACNFQKKLCTVDVSPYYFGATAGLAGVFNHEPADDFMTPKRKVVDQSDFVQSWALEGDSCTDRYEMPPCERVSEMCSALFNDSNSPLRSCFPLIPTEAYYKICHLDTCNDTDSKKACAAVHAYAHECNLVGGRFQLPSQCVECASVDRTTYDASVYKDSVVSAMDLVLVIERGSCMSERGVASSMRKFLKKFGSELSENRMRDVHYHLVGYGGPSARPSTITIRNKPYSRNRNHVLKTLKKINLTNEEMYADTLGAISYASQLPFRAGAKPVIVVLPCESCHSSEASYSAVERQIRKLGILLHHLPQRPIVAGSNSKSMFGFDANFAFSRGNKVNSNVIKPNKEDICEPLATITGGSVWNGSSLMKGSSAFHKKFSAYLVSQIGKGQSQTCHCEMNDNGVATSVCT